MPSPRETKPVPTLLRTSDARSYRVISRLGSGGFATVYRAELVGPAGFAKQVALKVLKPEQGMDVQTRLRDEARVLGLFRHPCVVGIDGLVELDVGWAVVMEYIPGVDLSSVIRDGPLPLSVVLEIGACVAGALHAAHADVSELTGEPLRLIHRDIKPANVRLTRYGEVKILDFGGARAVFDNRETVTERVLGSFHYIAPERLDGLDLPVCDVYSLGILLAELLIGEKFKGAVKHISGHDAWIARMGEAMVAGLSGEAAGEIREGLAEMSSYSPANRPSAADVASRLRAMGRAAEGPDLATWCAEWVPRLQAEMAAAGEGEQIPTGPITITETPAPAHTQRSPPASRAPRVAVAAGLLALTVLVAASWWAVGRAPAESPAPEALMVPGTPEQVVEAPAVPAPAPRPPEGAAEKKGVFRKNRP